MSPLLPHALGLAPAIARGGKAVYGAPLGILMLEARFPRILGDMGNAQTVLPGALPRREGREPRAGHSGSGGHLLGSCREWSR